MNEQQKCRPGSLSGELRVATGRLQRALRRQRGEADLPEGQFAVLSVLHKHGAMTAGALAEHEGVRPPSMTRTVNALSDLGLVRKDVNPQDARQVVVVLTDTGRAELIETRRRREAWLTTRLSTLEPAERQTLAQAAEILLRVTGR